MSYRDCLHTFLTVYRLGSQLKAAESLAMTQPGVSQHVKTLEHYLNRPLFIKVGRKLEPTAVAHQLALSITDALDTLDDVLSTMKQGGNPLRGDVYVGGLSEFFGKVVVPHLSKLSQTDINIRFEIDYSTLLPRLLNNELHLAQFVEFVTHPQITIEKIYHQKFIMIGHPKFKELISKKELDKNNISTLKDLPWLTYNETLLFIKQYFHTVFGKEFNGEPKLIISDLYAILDAVRAGFGVTVLSSYFCQEYIDNKNVVVLYESKNAPRHYFYLGWKQGALRDPKVKLVYDIIKEAGAESE
ncbi:MAG: LysR family transcriptional regulator [Gammaproteobacteria bacterium]|nr:LysR family transcriptional regulator [Gammaproteobacteria bacterium]